MHLRRYPSSPFVTEKWLIVTYAISYTHMVYYIAQYAAS